MELSVDLSHLREAYRPTALLTDEERIRWIQHERWIHYSRAETALTRLGELLHYPPRDRMPCLLLFGMTGMGKTRILQKFLRDHDAHYEACAGTYDAKQALMTDQQLADRFEAMELPAWKDDGAFQNLLSSFAAILPLRQPSGLLDAKTRKRVLALSEGIMVRICRLLEVAAVQAIRSGAERIELASLSEEVLTNTLVSIADRRSRRATA
jgi:hypothetical protein